MGGWLMIVMMMEMVPYARNTMINISKEKHILYTDYTLRTKYFHVLLFKSDATIWICKMCDFMRRVGI